MLYVKRNDKGQITGLAESSEPGGERVNMADPEVREFLGIEQSHVGTESALRESDVFVARVLEDLIDVLIQRNLIMFTDLPEAAKQKLLTRRLLRSTITKNSQQANESDPMDDSHVSSILGDD